jgi:hypothetical protein
LPRRFAAFAGWGIEVHWLLVSAAMGRNGNDVFVLGEEAFDADSIPDRFEDEETAPRSRSPFAASPTAPAAMRPSRGASRVGTRRALAAVGLGGGIVVLLGVLVLGGSGGSSVDSPAPARTEAPVVKVGASAQPRRPVRVYRRAEIAPAHSLGRVVREQPRPLPEHAHHRRVHSSGPAPVSAPAVEESVPEESAPEPVSVAVPQPPSPPPVSSPPPASGGGSSGRPEFSFER